jgi:hypothetical protein
MKLRRNIILVVAALMLAGSFYLPNAVAGITDARRLNQLMLIDSQTVSFDAVPELSLSERLALLSRADTEVLPWLSGNVMDAEVAKNRAVRELARFFRNSPYELDTFEMTVEESAASFVIDAAVPTLNLVVWELTLTDSSDNTVTVSLDDETGVILKVLYRRSAAAQDADGTSSPGAATTDEELHAKAQRLAEMMTEYFGQPVALADYQFSGRLSYYRADLICDGRVIPMFGVVRATSFTINERV